MLMRSNAAVVAFRLVSIALQMAYIKLYSHYLSVAELGVFFYIMTLSYSINALLLVPLDFYQQAKLIKYYTAKLPLRALLVLNAQGLSAAFFLAMTLGGAVWVTGHIDFLSLVIAYFIAVSTYLCNAFRGFLNNIGHKYLVVFMLVMEVMMRMGLFILLMMFSLSKVHALIISSAVALVIEIGCFFLFFRGKNLCSFEDKTIFPMPEILAALYPVSISAVCNWLQLQGYRMIYVWSGHAGVVGIYATVANIGSVGMNACGTAFSQVFLPKLYSSRGAYIKQYLKWVILLCLTALLGGAIFGKLALDLFTRQELVAFSGIIIFGVASEACNFMAGAITTYLTIISRARQLIVANLSGLVVSIMGGVAGIYFLPDNPYVIGTVIACSQLVVVAVLYKKIYQRESEKISHVH